MFSYYCTIYTSTLFNGLINLVPRVLPSLTPCCGNTLVPAGHVAPRFWVAEINCYLGRGGIAMICYVLRIRVLRDNKIFELEEMLKKTKNTRLIMCCSRKSIILLSKITNISYFTVSSLYRLVSKSTPKKFYKKSFGSTENSSRCRLCNGVQVQRHCKNLFNKTN